MLSSWEQLGQGIRTFCVTLSSSSAPLPIASVEKSFNIMSPIFRPRGPISSGHPWERVGHPPEYQGWPVITTGLARAHLVKYLEVGVCGIIACRSFVALGR